MRDSGGFMAIGLTALLTAGCSDGETTGSHSETLSPCDPLASVEQSIMLGNIIAIGRSENDTLYVVDDGDDGQGRVFASGGNELVRFRVGGSGQGNSGDARTYLYIFEDSENQARTLSIEAKAGTTRMAIAEGEQERDFDAVAAAGEELTVLDDSAIEGLQLRNLPGEIEIEYFARTEDGARWVVTRPRDDWSYEDFRLFHGKGSTLREAHVIDVVRYKDGGTTKISFELDGTQALAYFPSPLSSSDEAASLTVDEQTLGLTELAAQDELADFSFECFGGA